MVFLSLLLGTDLSVLTNSSKLTTDIRQALTEEDYGLEYAIGIVLALACCVTLVGLVATFSAWSMISAISESNCNTLLRSSMGQYVTAMPSRFVVASLYLFLVWLTLMLIQIISGPLILLVLAVIVYLFFQVVVSLSAFGRLIVHTGAMGKKRVLDPEFERQLLPSGLHASLLIKATERSRRRTSATEQYRYSKSTPSQRNVHSSMSSGNSGDTPPVTGDHSRMSIETSSLNNLSSSFLSEQSPYGRPTRKRLDSEETRAIEHADRAFGGAGMETVPLEPHESTNSFPTALPTHVRKESEDDSCDELANQIFFPRASVLNNAGHSQLKKIVNQTLSTRDMDELAEIVEQASAELERRSSMAAADGTPKVDAVNGDTPKTRYRKLAVRRSRQVSEAHARLQAEWEVEDDVRNVYDIEPPVEIFSPEEIQLNRATSRPLPRPSLLNRTKRLGSLRNLVTNFDPRRFSLTRTNSAPIRPGLEQIEEKYSFEDLSVPSPAAIPSTSEDSPTGKDGGTYQGRTNTADDEESSGERQYLLGGNKSNHNT